MQMSMNVIYKIVPFILLGIGLVSCKDQVTTKQEQSIVGIYTMHVKVNKRPPIIKYHYGRPRIIPFDHQIIYDEVMDTTQDICCPSKITGAHDCPWEYSIKNVKIFKDNNQYFLQNSLDITPSGEQITFHVPLYEAEGNLIYDRTKHPDIGYYSIKQHEMPSTGGNWPDAFILLYFSIENNAQNTLRGKWVLKDLLDDECRTHALMSDGQIHPCRMGEFAEFTLTKVE